MCSTANQSDYEGNLHYNKIDEINSGKTISSDELIITDKTQSDEDCEADVCTSEKTSSQKNPGAEVAEYSSIYTNNNSPGNNSISNNYTNSHGYSNSNYESQIRLKAEIINYEKYVNYSNHMKHGSVNVGYHMEPKNTISKQTNKINDECEEYKNKNNHELRDQGDEVNNPINCEKKFINKLEGFENKKENMSHKRYFTLMYNREESKEVSSNYLNDKLNNETNMNNRFQENRDVTRSSNDHSGQANLMIDIHRHKHLDDHESEHDLSKNIIDRNSQENNINHEQSSERCIIIRNEHTNSDTHEHIEGADESSHFHNVTMANTPTEGQWNVIELQNRCQHPEEEASQQEGLLPPDEVDVFFNTITRVGTYHPSHSSASGVQHTYYAEPSQSKSFCYIILFNSYKND